MTVPDTSTAGTWHDQAPAVAEAASGLLRLEASHPDRDTMEAKARAACRAIDEHLELRPATGRMFYAVSDVWSLTTYPSGGAPADVMDAALQLTMELYQRKDAPFGISRAWSPTGEPLRISRDQLAGVESLLAPHIEGWGLA